MISHCPACSRLLSRERDIPKRTYHRWRCLTPDCPRYKVWIKQRIRLRHIRSKLRPNQSS